MKLMILVLNWEQPQKTLECLASLRQADLRGGEILVIDNGSRDDSVAVLRAADPSLRLIALPENLGYAGGNNVGLRLALEEGADRVLVLNNDTTVDRPLPGVPDGGARLAAGGRRGLRRGRIAPTGRRCSTSPTRR